MLDHLLYILHHQDVDILIKETELISEWLAEKILEKYGRRISRITTQEELFPLAELQKACL